MTPEKDQINWGVSDRQKQIEDMLLTDNQLSYYQCNYGNQYTIAKEIIECF